MLGTGSAADFRSRQQFLSHMQNTTASILGARSETRTICFSPIKVVVHKLNVEEKLLKILLCTKCLKSSATGHPSRCD